MGAAQCLKTDFEFQSWEGGKQKMIANCASQCKPDSCPYYPIDCHGMVEENKNCTHQDGFQLCQRSMRQASAHTASTASMCSGCTKQSGWECDQWRCKERECNKLDDSDTGTWFESPMHSCSGCPASFKCHSAA